jgi:hypothetical protein
MIEREEKEIYILRNKKQKNVPDMSVFLKNVIRA